MLALAELRELLFELPLAAVEVGGPGHQPRLQSPLRARDSLGELHARVLGLARDRVAPLLGERTLLLAERVARLGALAREHPVELGPALLRLLFEVVVELGARVRRRPARSP